MAGRLLRPVPGSVQGLTSALESALDGRGPAVLPLPPDAAEAARVAAALRADDPAVPVERDDVAVVVATSGSTGYPKGVLLPAQALRWSAAATHDRLGGPGRWLLALPAHHVAGLQVLVRSLLAGTSPAAMDLARGFTAAGFAAASTRLRYGGGRRYAALVPMQLRRILDAGGEPVAALASYDAVLVGGASVPLTLLARARDAGARVVTTYGLSETCGGCVYDGTPLGGVSVAVGADGRIRLAGRVLFAGYRLRPDLTAGALVDGWLVTPDRGRLEPDGRLAVLGRIDDVVVSGGVNVSLSAVEEALVEHPAIREAAAVGVDDEEWGTRIVAVVVPAGEPPSLRELGAWVGGRVGRAAAARQLLLTERLPLAGPGKVDRRELADRAAAAWTPAATRPYPS